MNINTGHLIRNLGDLSTAEAAALGYVQVPRKLEAEAVRQLQDKKEAHIDLRAASPLAKWAAHERKERSKKNKRKMAKNSKQKNRK